MAGKKLLVQNPASAIKDWQIELRQALFSSITPDDVQAIAAGLVQKAKAGDQAAIKLLFTHVLGGGGVNIRQGVVMMGDAPSAEASERDREPSPAKRLVCHDRDDIDDGGEWLVVGIKEDWERVILGSGSTQQVAEAKLSQLKGHVEGYREIVLEKMAG